MSGPDSAGSDWYYLNGSAAQGPVGAAEIARLIRAGVLNGNTQVGQAGSQAWSPASAALARWLAVADPPPQPAPEPLTFAIRIQCISGPDAGHAYMIGAPEVALGKVSGLGQSDPFVADTHVILSWRNSVLHFRTSPGGSALRVSGVELTEGSLTSGQQFQLGSSVWQVGHSAVELSGLLGSLGARLNKLASTDKLEGFSLSVMFADVFKKRPPEELEDYFVVGTTKTTPPLSQVPTGWPQPWFFMRILMFLAAVYAVLYAGFRSFQNLNLVPGLMMMGALAVPLATVFLFWEMNTPRNVSFHLVLKLVCLGGVISLFVSLLIDSLGTLDWLGIASAGIVEETGKLLAVIMVVRGTRYRWILNGMVFGAAIGGGFAAFESAGYAFRGGLEGGAEVLLHSIGLRAVLAPFGHMLWTAIAAGALWRAKGAEPFRLNMLLNPVFLRTFLIPVALHTLWDAPFLDSEPAVYIKFLALGIAGWYVAFSLIQQGLRQVRDAQVTDAQAEMRQTQQLLITTRSNRAM